MPRNLVGWLGLGTCFLGFAVSVFVFVRVQVLQAYPFYEGVYGNEPLLPGITYTIGLEIFSSIALIGLFVWAYSQAEGEREERLRAAVGRTLLVFGVLVALVVYVETQLLWGQLVPGIHVWGGLPGGGGYPWGTEQVAYNTCFVSSAVKWDCTFINYNDLFWFAFLCAVVGYVLEFWPRTD